MSDGEQDFAAFEAQANEGVEGKAEVVPDEKAKDEPKPDPKDDDTLELTEDDEAVDVEDGEEGGEEHEDSDGKKRRSKPASQRIAEERWKRGEAERERDELIARIAALEGKVDKPAVEKPEAPAKPDPSEFEYGEADPAYIDAMVDWKLETRDAEKAAKNAEVEGANAEKQQWVERIEIGVAKAQTEGQEKYEDFDEKITAAVEARAGEPLPPVLSVAIGVSPAGGDILYRLATDPAVSQRIEALARGGEAKMPQLAQAFGELEGEFLADSDDSDLDMTDSLDMARMMGRMRARLKGAAKPAENKTVTVTGAPEPPENRARGSGGQYEVRGDTSDFAAFERKANAKR